MKTKHLLVSWMLVGGGAFAAGWEPLPPLPDTEGFAGAFAGVSDGALVVAGGTNFPDKMPWEGGTKTWYSQVHVLHSPGEGWRAAGSLPTPNGYGVSLTTASGLVLIGGGNAERHYREVFRLRLVQGGAITEPLPPLPEPCAYMTGAVEAARLYVAGGIRHPADTSAMGTLWMLDLDNPGAGWQALPPCPGPPRILAQMAVVGGAVHLFSGASLKPGPDGKAARTWLKDAWRHTPGKGWDRLADMPHVTVAAPCPAALLGGELWILGGDDGLNADFEPRAKHPGFPRRILAYEMAENRWRVIKEELPFSLVTTPLVTWRGHWVVPGGEARPGKRSPQVWWRPVPAP